MTADELKQIRDKADRQYIDQGMVPSLLDMKALLKEVDRLRHGIAEAAAALSRDGHDQEDENDRCLTCETYYDLLRLIGKEKPSPA